MSQHIVKILEAHYITHDVKRFAVEKPKGYDFIPGQATQVSINLPEWKDQLRPFTFTSLRELGYLEFMIKIYDDHNGVTKKLGSINAGAELIIHDVFGAIKYKGPGIFIAGGSGITPFISIFRELYKHRNIHGNKLIYSNKTSEDVIMEAELRTMLQNDFINIFTRENIVGFRGIRIDRNFLVKNIADFGQNFYLCGPKAFVENITQLLLDLGATAETLIFEK
ncbi:flavodoxin reductase [Sediminicola sp. YIK13]|uniref:FAD-binding oxidoreductase n=1 Tax=Sediminicola sp. YIK13 TaxID=1453352 RepID=UPI00072001B3|nr:FAD-binding oxidoreductase [Sediminicola sp. YIK13]ALM07997.1 flavodoxin reductase [Sediminicola sp. YIK13]